MQCKNGEIAILQTLGCNLYRPFYWSTFFQLVRIIQITERIVLLNITKIVRSRYFFEHPNGV